MRSPQFLFACLLASFASFLGGPARAQINPDTTLGAESSIVTPNAEVRGAPADLIEGGAVREAALFHSFTDFNVLASERAYFFNPQGIESIFSRITGGDRSNIFGTLGVDGAADLFLLNPNGFVFGPDAELDVPGSLYVTTADEISLGEGGVFSAIAPNQNQFLTVRPNTLFSNYLSANALSANAGDIESEGQIGAGENLALVANNIRLEGSVSAGDQLSLLAADTLQIRDTAEEPFIAFAGGDLLAQGNQQVDIVALSHENSRLFSSGDMVLRSAGDVLGDTHYTSNGSFRVEDLAGQASSLVSFYDPIIFANGDVVFGVYTGTSLHILAGGSVGIGQITVTAADSTGTAITPASFPDLSSVETSNGQRLSIDGSARATVDIRAGIDWSGLNSSLPDQNIGLTIPDGLFDTSSTGAVIAIVSIKQTAPNSLTFLSNQFFPNLALPLGDILIGEIVTTDTAGPFIGDAGDVVIDSRGDISVASRIESVSTFGNGGDVTLIAQDSVALQNSYISTVIDGVSALSDRKAGDIQIDSGSFSLRNGQFAASTATSGNSGNITITARDSVEIVGVAGDTTTSLSTAVRQGGDGIAGDFTIDTRRLVVESAQLSTSVQGSGRVGKLEIIAPDSVDLRGEVFNSAGRAIFPGGVLAQVDVGDEGIAGELTIETALLNVSDGSKIQVGSFGSGDAGVLTIRADDVNLFNTADPTFFTGIFGGILQDPNSSTTLPEGNGGQVNIYAERVSVRDGSRVTADVSGLGEGGTIFIQANERLEVVGDSKTTPSTIGAEVNPPGVVTPISPEQIVGSGGDVVIEAGQISLREGGTLSVSTFGNGDSGDIRVRDTQLIEIIGTSLSGSPSSISARVGENAVGRGGDINIEAEQLTLTAGGEINTRSDGTGDAGNITLGLADGSLNVEDSEIKTSSAQSSGGSIFIHAGSILLEGDGDIRTEVSQGEGAGGSIVIVANSIVAFDDSDILAFAADGRGGDITLTTPAFFGERYVPDSLAPFETNNRVDINASGRLASGTISIPETSLIDNDLSELSDSLIDTDALVATSCVARSVDAAGTLTVGGGDRLPLTPTEVISIPYSVGTVQPVSVDGSHTVTEPLAVYKLADGRLMMGRDCKT